MRIKYHLYINGELRESQYNTAFPFYALIQPDCGPVLFEIKTTQEGEGTTYHIGNSLVTLDDLCSLSPDTLILVYGANGDYLGTVTNSAGELYCIGCSGKVEKIF